MTESGIEAPWSVVVNPTDYAVTSGENTTVDVTVTNTYATGSLTVLKAVETNGAVGLTIPDFSITIKGPSYPNGDTKTFNETIGMKQTWTNLIPGTYIVTEPGVEAPWESTTGSQRLSGDWFWLASDRAQGIYSLSDDTHLSDSGIFCWIGEGSRTAGGSAGK